MMQYLESDVKSTLEPFNSFIVDAIQSGFSDWLEVKSCMEHKGLSPFIYSRTRSNIIFDCVAKHAISNFLELEDDGAKTKVESQTVKFLFKDVVVARFKKGNAEHLGMNIPTQQNMAFCSPQAILEGFPPEAATVDITWELSECEDSVEKIYVAARDNKMQLWCYEIGIEQSNTVVYKLPQNEPDSNFNQISNSGLVSPKKRTSEESKG